jgi:hypothetical protein
MQRAFTGGLLLLLAGGAFGQAAPAAAPDAATEPPSFASKLTIGIYHQNGDTANDLNLRHQFGDTITAWLGAFIAADHHVIGRTGGQYAWQRENVLVQPGLEAGTNGFVMETLYSELGGDAFAIAGYSRTNLKPTIDITFDPNDSAQLGGGWKHGGDRIAAYSIFDIRLNTRQQDTHVIWKHRVDKHTALTLDTIYKSGHTDSGRYVHAIGAGLYYDHAWFAKLYYDPFANFSDHSMLRLTFGKKF